MTVYHYADYTPDITVAVVGSRGFEPLGLVKDVLEERFPVGGDKPFIVSGGAKGPDSAAVDWAVRRDLNYYEHIPDWETYGKSAGFRRNVAIVDSADFVLAFWDGRSAGTKHSITLAFKRRVPIQIFYSNKVWV